MRLKSIKPYQVLICVLVVSSEQNGEGNGTPLQYSCLENPMEHLIYVADCSCSCDAPA